MWFMGGNGGANQAPPQPQQPPMVLGQQLVPAGGQPMNPALPNANVAGNQNFAYFSFLEIINLAPNVREMAMTIFMVQCMIAVLGVMFWGVYKTVKRILGYLRDFYVLVSGRLRSVDVAGVFC